MKFYEKTKKIKSSGLLEQNDIGSVIEEYVELIDNHKNENIDPNKIYEAENINNEIINDQITNDGITNNEITNEQIVNNEITNDQIINNEIINNEIINNEIINNEIINNEIVNNEIINNEIINNEIINNEIINNEIINNEIINNEIINNEITNNEITNNEIINNEIINNEIINNEIINNEIINNEIANNEITNNEITINKPKSKISSEAKKIIELWLINHIRRSKNNSILNKDFYDFYVNCGCNICFPNGYKKISKQKFIEIIRIILNETQNFNFMEISRKYISKSKYSYIFGVTYNENHDDTK